MTRNRLPPHTSKFFPSHNQYSWKSVVQICYEIVYRVQYYCRLLDISISHGILWHFREVNTIVDYLTFRYRMEFFDISERWILLSITRHFDIAWNTLIFPSKLITCLGYERRFMPRLIRTSLWLYTLTLPQLWYRFQFHAWKNKYFKKSLVREREVVTIPPNILPAYTETCPCKYRTISASIN